MSGKLSERFAALSAPVAKKPQRAAPAVTPRDNRVSSRMMSQHDNRTANTMQKRTGAAAHAQGNVSRPKSAGSANMKPVLNGKGGNRPQKKGSKKDNTRKEKKKPVSQDDLDKEMDTYWFEAGKGPNPEVANLDKDLDAYFEAKPAAADAAAAAPVEQEPAAEVTVEA